MMMRPKNQRLLLAMVALFAIAAASGLALWGLQSKAAYFVTPAQIEAGEVEPGVPLRLGGMVVEGSVSRWQSGDAEITGFALGDGVGMVHVIYAGILPDLFREGSGAVVEGQLGETGEFEADRILAKHDERYMPPELGDLEATQETVAP